MTINVQPVTEMVRCYEDVSFEEKSSYVAIVTIFYETHNKAYLFGMCGSFTKKFYLEIVQHLKQKGVIEFRMERRGRMVTRVIS